MAVTDTTPAINRKKRAGWAWPGEMSAWALLTNIQHRLHRILSCFIDKIGHKLKQNIKDFVLIRPVASVNGPTNT